MEDFDSVWQAVNDLKPVDGVMAVDMLDMPGPLGGIMRKLIRLGCMPLPEFAENLHAEPSQARRIGEVLVKKGYMTVEMRLQDGQITYRACVARARKRNIPLDL